MQVLIDESRWRRLEERARRRGVSVGHVVREAIDAYLPSDEERRRRAWQELLAAPKMEVPDPDELRREINEARSRGL